MRIIAGSRKGARIYAPKGRETRPTGDRVREAAFNLIGPLAGARVLDLYAGSGAMGPSLREGRAVVQFPDIADHYDFVVKGSSNGAQYGVNGIGRGWMPGFGAMLSGDDIMLIVRFERTLR